MTSANLPDPPTNSLSRRELLAVVLGAGAVGAGVVLTGEAAEDDRRTYADVRGTGTVSETVEIEDRAALVATAELLGEFPAGDAPEVSIELVYLEDEKLVFRAVDTGSVSERVRVEGSGTYRFRVESDGEFRATLKDQKTGLF